MKKKDAAVLAKPLGVAPVQANALLVREEMRAQGRKDWLAREGDPVLPTHVQFQYQAQIVGDGIAGQVGIDHHALFGHLEHPVQVASSAPAARAVRARCQHSQRNGIRRRVHPNDDYRDAVRDKIFVRVLLTVRGLARADWAASLTIATSFAAPTFADW
jgi:hypothetical protein